MGKKMKTFSPKKIADNLYLQHSYNDIIRAVKRGQEVKDLKWIDENLQLQFITLTRDEIIQFDQQVKEHLQVIEKRDEIRRLRNRIANASIRITQLENELNNG